MKRKGFTLVEVMIVVAIIALLAAIAIPNLLRARLQANEAAAQGALKTIATAQITYLSANENYTSLVLLSGATPPYIDGALGAGTRNGYGFTVTGAGTNSYFTVIAAPSNINVTGQRYFCIQQDGVLRASAAVITNATCPAATAVGS